MKKNFFALVSALRRAGRRRKHARIQGFVKDRVTGRVSFLVKTFPKKRIFYLFPVNRIPVIPFILLSGAEWTEL